MDNLPDNTWINDTDSVQNPGAAQNVLDEYVNYLIDTEFSGQNSVAVQQSVLDHSLFSPENLPCTLEEPDQDFQEEFINISLATSMPTESIMNSLYTDLTAGYLSSELNIGNNVILEPSLESDAAMVQNAIPETSSFHETPCMPVNDAPFFPSLENCETLGEINVKPNVHTATACLDTESYNLANNGNLEPSNSLDSTSAAEVPELSPSLPVSPANTTIANDSSLNMNQLEPAIVALLEKFEKSNHENHGFLQRSHSSDSTNSRKRPLEENSSSAKGVAPASKKIMGQPCSSRDEETVPDNIVKNRKKNTASRVRGPSKLLLRVLEQKKQLEKENEELKCKLEELSREFEFRRNYIVSKLKGQC